MNTVFKCIIDGYSLAAIIVLSLALGRGIILAIGTIWSVLF